MAESIFACTHGNGAEKTVKKNICDSMTTSPTAEDYNSAAGEVFVFIPKSKSLKLLPTLKSTTSLLCLSKAYTIHIWQLFLPKNIIVFAMQTLNTTTDTQHLICFHIHCFLAVFSYKNTKKDSFFL
jgi:hypothetical protein